ncbi:MAG TPA: BglII/BstYI family type II restriction endonuclease [Solirubrobacteraceae bacterium]|nr:BglII/BstYI family type II restriction endonuclease [Solirubrobacteraceae bacterium]
MTRYDFGEVREAATILSTTNPDEFDDLVRVLQRFRLTREDVLTAGGNEGLIAKRLNDEFRMRGWREGRHDQTVTSKLSLMPYKPAGEKEATATESEVENTGYKVDNVKSGIALDVEWNAKDGNLDRDLGAYSALYDLGIIRGGVLITRSHDDLRALGAELGRPDFVKTTTTTNLGKLIPRLSRGSAGGCPVLAIAITARCLAP